MFSFFLRLYDIVSNLIDGLIEVGSFVVDIKILNVLFYGFCEEGMLEEVFRIREEILGCGFIIYIFL